MKEMTNKKIWLGVLLILAVFAVFVSGCSSSSNYYNLGNVSEENCALIIVSPLGKVIDRENSRLLESDYSFIDLVKIDGQGEFEQWQKPPENIFGIKNQKAIVRVTPGVHKFTINILYDDSMGKYFFPVDVTYDCKAGKAYLFDFLVEDPVARRAEASGFFTLNEQTGERGGIKQMGFLATTIVINEADVGANGIFGFGKEVARKTESLALNPDLQRSPTDTRQSVDRERLVRRPN